ncbi:hypothetical protein ATC04_12135 [Arthrobacter sp. YC-RL1]|nr:hypothetical protein ATC04_12135 [Arthrobacter sp. YC-RL1]
MDAAAAKAKETAKKTEDAGKASESGIGRLAQTANAHEQAWNQVSTGMVASGTAVVGALTLSTKAAMDWESAWTGVTKTVDGTPAQMAEMETGLRKLARTLPSTHAEIAGVAEAAGQLGVARDDILGFTKTMVDLGESTNLTAEDAATNIAQISNVMGTMEREGAKGVERFGSALVALGNDGASTEAEILSMAQRISGAGATLGATEADVLALSNTLASMGVRAELGGGVTTRVLLKMRSAVDEGGESLEAFAKIAGLSADEFGAKFKAAPIEALDLVSKGIYRVNEAGGNVTATLKDMGIKGTEETQVMLALANSGDLLADSLELGAKAWSENSALVDEATKRYETAESKVKIAWNNIKDAAISAGSVILPVVADIAGVVADLAGAFSDLPGPVQTALVVLGGLAGVGALVAGGLMKLVPAVTGTITGLKGLDAALGGGIIPGFGKADREARRTATSVANFGKKASAAQIATAGLKGALIGAAIGFGAFTTAAALHNRGLEAAKGPGHYVLELQKIGDEVSNVDNLFKNLDFGDSTAFEGKINGIGDALKELNRGGLDHFAADMGARNHIAILRENVEGLDQALATAAASGNAESTAKAWEQITAAADGQGMSVEKLESLFPEYVDALKSAEAASSGAGGGMAGLAESLDAAGASAELAAEKIDNFYNDLVNKGMVVIGENEALRRLQESINSASDTIAENGKVVNKNGEAYDKTSKKYLESSAALDGIASSTLAVIDPMRAAGASTAEMSDEIAHGRENFIKQAVAMGYSEKAAAAYADQLNLIPGAVYIQFDSNTDDLAGKLTEIHELVKSTPNGKVTIDENSPAVISALEALGYIVTTLPDGRIQVSETGTDATGKKIDETAGKKRTAKINAEAITGAAENALNNAARDRSSTIHTRVVTTKETYESTGRGGRGGQTVGGYTGGLVGQLIKGAADGGLVPGVVPLNSQGDNILATVNGKPFGLRSGEMVVNEEATKKNYPLLKAINEGAVVSLPGLAGGGLVGKAEKRVKSAQKAYNSIDGKKANKVRKQAAKDQLEAAKAELKAAKESKKKSDEAAKEARERAGRLGELRFDLARDLKRGDITNAFTSGSGMSVVDRLFEQSKNKDLSKGKRSALRSVAYGMESQLLGLEKQSKKLETQLDKATAARDRLLEVSKSVASGLRGEYSLGGVLSNLLSGEQKGPLSAGSFVKSAQGKAAQFKRFGKMLERLRKKGYNEAIIQEIADLGTVEGTQVGNALLNATGKERQQLNDAYKSMDYWSGQAGDEVTKSMYRGGIDAADGLVRGLEGKSKDVEDAFYKLGKSAEKAFRRSLDMHSPSRTLAVSGRDALDGILVGHDDRRQAVIDAYAGLGHDVAAAYQPNLALAVPPSYEVARYAQAQAAPIDYERLTNMVIAAARATPVEASIHLDGVKLGKGIAYIQNNATRGKPAAPFLARI